MKVLLLTGSVLLLVVLAQTGGPAKPQPTPLQQAYNSVCLVNLDTGCSLVR